MPLGVGSPQRARRPNPSTLPPPSPILCSESSWLKKSGWILSQEMIAHADPTLISVPAEWRAFECNLMLLIGSCLPEIRIRPAAGLRACRQPGFWALESIKKTQAISPYGSDRDRRLQIEECAVAGGAEGNRSNGRPAKSTGSAVDPSGRRIDGYRLNINPATTQ
jgi:hypothetical protein